MRFRHPAKVLLLTWASYAFFYSTMMPYILDKTPRQLLLPGIFAGFFVGLLTAVGDAVRVARRTRQAPLNEELR